VYVHVAQKTYMTISFSSKRSQTHIIIHVITNRKNQARIMDKKYIYGLDISLKQTGVAIYDFDERKFVFIGSFNTEKIYATKNFKDLDIHAIKLKQLTAWFREILKEFPPYIISAEGMIDKQINGRRMNPVATWTIAKATGVIQTMVWDKQQYFYKPKAVKAKIWHGDATKEEVASEILKRYPDLVFNNDDESDAVAVVLTFLIDHDLIEWEKSPKPEKKKRTTKKKTETKEKPS
jgi:Holliday junction resolvasome RuvABC endonuclease subunit